MLIVLLDICIAWPKKPKNRPLPRMRNMDRCPVHRYRSRSGNRHREPNRSEIGARFLDWSIQALRACLREKLALRGKPPTTIGFACAIRAEDQKHCRFTTNYNHCMNALFHRDFRDWRTSTEWAQTQFRANWKRPAESCSLDMAKAPAILQYLHWLVGCEAVLLPIRTKTKGPTWSNWQRTTFADTEDPHYQHQLLIAIEHGNVGVLLGHASANLVAKYCDCWSFRLYAGGSSTGASKA
jgi:hypothetical protein